jgi:hypothetical protein
VRPQGRPATVCSSEPPVGTLQWWFMWELAFEPHHKIQALRQMVFLNRSETWCAAHSG